MTLTTLQQSVLLTLAYTLQFDFPLTHNELVTRLVFLNEKSRTNVLEKELQELLDRGIVNSKGKWLSLAGFEKAYVTRARRSAIAADRQVEVQEFLKMILFLPWIQAVYVTGALAMNNAEADEDIDFMIITKARRLWLARLVISVLTLFKGKRRTRDKEEKKSWCFNLWLTEDQLSVFAEQPSVYVAYELIQAQSVLDRNNIDSKMRRAHSWVGDFLPMSGWGRAPGAGDKVLGTRSRVRGTGFSGFSDSLLSVADWCAYQLQLCYMRPHMTRERVTREVAFFHPRDTEGWIWDRWAAVLSQVAFTLEQRRKNL